MQGSWLVLTLGWGFRLGRLRHAWGRQARSSYGVIRESGPVRPAASAGAYTAPGFAFMGQDTFPVSAMGMSPSSLAQPAARLPPSVELQIGQSIRLPRIGSC